MTNRPPAVEAAMKELELSGMYFSETLIEHIRQLEQAAPVQGWQHVKTELIKRRDELEVNLGKCLRSSMRHFISERLSELHKVEILVGLRPSSDIAATGDR